MQGAEEEEKNIETKEENMTTHFEMPEQWIYP
jgi:hypothetical protein